MWDFMVLLKLIEQVEILYLTILRLSLTHWLGFGLSVEIYHWEDNKGI